MKNIMNRIICVALIILMSVVFFSCAEVESPEKQNNTATEEKSGLWSNAIYTENKTFGSGAKTFELEIKTEDKSVTFTIKTDADNLEEALVEHKLIEGEEGPYGMYIKKVNGITADYDVDKSYWSFSKNGEYMMTGVDKTEIENGAHYELVYTK